MKILAIEKELKTVNWGNESQTLIDEAKSAYKMMLSGHLREMYFNDKKNDVLIQDSYREVAAKDLRYKSVEELKKVKHKAMISAVEKARELGIASTLDIL